MKWFLAMFWTFNNGELVEPHVLPIPVSVQTLDQCKAHIARIETARGVKLPYATCVIASSAQEAITNLLDDGSNWPYCYPMVPDDPNDGLFERRRARESGETCPMPRDVNP